MGGNTSSKQNPGAIFTEPGSYTICLTVTDTNGNSDTECQRRLYYILPNPVSSFVADTDRRMRPNQRSLQRTCPRLKMALYHPGFGILEEAQVCKYSEIPHK